MNDKFLNSALSLCLIVTATLVLSGCANFEGVTYEKPDPYAPKPAGYSKCEDRELKDYYDCPGDHMGNSAPNGNYDYPKDKDGYPDDHGRLPH